MVLASATCSLIILRSPPSSGNRSPSPAKVVPNCLLSLHLPGLISLLWSVVTYGFTDTNPNYNIQANFGAIKLIPNKNQDGSLCQANTINLLLNVGKIEISAVNTGCPVPSGDVQLSVQIPVAPLHGTVLGHFNIYKADKSKAVCLDLSVKVWLSLWYFFGVIFTWDASSPTPCQFIDYMLTCRAWVSLQLLNQVNEGWACN